MAVTQAVSGIKVERPGVEQLKQLGVSNWPIWSKEASTFAWSYGETEICYFLEGRAMVKTDQGEVSFGAGDLVTFPKGLACTWQITQPVRKHYRIG